MTASPETTSRRPVEWHRIIREITTGSGIVSVLAILVALILGSLLVAFTDSTVQAAAGYFFAQPGDLFVAIGNSMAQTYTALFKGAVLDLGRPEFSQAIRPLTETLNFATPLIAAGLGVGLGFRAGLFNIGGRGQMLMAAAAAGWVGATLDLPWGVHLIVALVAGLLGGAIWAGIVGLLKARTGAHEVIVTIMLNYVAFYLITWFLRTPGLLRGPGSSNPKSAPMGENAVLPLLLGERFNLHAGFLVVMAATFLTWWLLERSAFGFRLRAVGENPAAARTGGISVPRVTVQVMCVVGALVGLAGAIQVLGTVPTGFTAGIDADIGVDAIIVALLGRSRPWGIFGAGLLFGAFKAGGFTLQASGGVPIEIVLIIQSLAVLLIAAPPLIRGLFRLPSPDAQPVNTTPAKVKEVAR